MSLAIFMNLTYQALPFQSFARPGGGLSGLDGKNQGHHQPIEIKLCVSLYNYKSMPDAKFEPFSLSSFEDMTS